LRVIVHPGLGTSYDYGNHSVTTLLLQYNNSTYAYIKLSAEISHAANISWTASYE